MGTLRFRNKHHTKQRGDPYRRTIVPHPLQTTRTMSSLILGIIGQIQRSTCDKTLQSPKGKIFSGLVSRPCVLPKQPPNLEGTA